MTANKYPKSSRRNIAIREDLHCQVKVKAAVQGISIVEAVEYALAQWLSKDSRHIRLITEKMSRHLPGEMGEVQ